MKIQNEKYYPNVTLVSQNKVTKSSFELLKTTFSKQKMTVTNSTLMKQKMTITGHFKKQSIHFETIHFETENDKSFLPVKLCHFNKKRKKCQPAARDTPDLIQTECVPDSGLTRQKNKLNEKIKIQNVKYLPNVTFARKHKHTKLTKELVAPNKKYCKMTTLTEKTRMMTLSTLKKQKMTNVISMMFCHFKIKRKTEKCQPAARDTPDLIQTECVPDSGLTRQKINRTKKIKFKIEITVAMLL